MTFPLLKAPFPWFGGKSRVADIVWRAFGNVPNYVEPFAGSLAVLLGRPTEARIETVNDLDCYLSNFWRAVQADPEAVARHADWPVNEADLFARHRWLVGRTEFREQLRADPDHFDAKIAGWWVWGLSAWIGGGWCAIRKPALHAQTPLISHAGMGVHKKMPNLSSHGGTGAGVHARFIVKEQLPDLQGNGRGITAGQRRRPRNKAAGIFASLPSLGNARGVHGSSKPPCHDWFADLQSRLRRVRVCCGDWTRVLGDSVIGTTKSRNSGMNPCGVFLDPPYSEGERDPDLYATDDGAVAARVADWAIARGDDPDLRIALCGYEGEHSMPAGWTCHPWKAHRGYSGESNDNPTRERIWFSPHCLPIDAVQTSLFGKGAA